MIAELLSATQPRQESAQSWFMRRTPCRVEELAALHTDGTLPIDSPDYVEPPRTQALRLLKSWLVGVASWNEQSKRDALRCAKQYKEELESIRGSS